MNIDVLEYIDSASEKLKSVKPQLTKATEKAVRYFTSCFKKHETEILDVTSRIKQNDSLKEKIIRKDLYKLYPVDALFSNLSDLIGIRIECRFLTDEVKVYDHLKEVFTHSDDGVFYYADDRDDIALNFSATQPQTQANGMEIYRIDGRMNIDGAYFNFELQIKSLVNAFWSEIEHKIIYKNKRFMMIDSFVSELMNSLSKSLYLIDNQLHMLYERCLNQSSALERTQIVNLLSLCVNEIFSKLVEQKFGFSVNIKNYCESIVQYIFSSSSFADEHQIHYGEVMLKTLQWIKDIDFLKIPLGETIRLNTKNLFDDPLEETIAKCLSKSINNDFFCNIFFHILFSVEIGDNESDFKRYVKYYKDYLLSDCACSKEKLQKALDRYDCSKLILMSTLENLRSALSDNA